MWTLGETLRQARLDKGVSLADAAHDTRIRRAYLEALEAEDAAALPPPVYTRGFVRTYAEYLGLDPQAMVELYQPTARRETGPPTLRPALPHIAIPRQIPLRPVLYGISAIAFVAMLGFAFSWYQEAQHVVNADTPRAARGTPTPSGVRLPTAIPILLATATPTLEPTPEPTASPTPVIDGILVEFRTSARVWVEAAVDGKQVVAEMLAPGTEKQLPLAQSSVIMRTSNGSAIDVTVNGAHQDPRTASDPIELTWQR